MDERMSADGNVVRALDLASAQKDLQRAFSTVAFAAARSCCMHGYRYPEHERQLAELAGASASRRFLFRTR